MLPEVVHVFMCVGGQTAVGKEGTATPRPGNSSQRMPYFPLYAGRTSIPRIPSTNWPTSSKGPPCLHPTFHLLWGDVCSYGEPLHSVAKGIPQLQKGCLNVPATSQLPLSTSLPSFPPLACQY